LSALREAGVQYLFVNLGSDHSGFMEAYALARASQDGGEFPYPQVITCPNALATDTNIKVLPNNGVTATVPPNQAVRPTATAAPGPNGGGGAAPAGGNPGNAAPAGGNPGNAAPAGGNPGNAAPAGGNPANGGGALPANAGGASPAQPAKTGYVTAGAPRSLKNGLLLAGAVAFAAGQFLLA